MKTPEKSWRTIKAIFGIPFGATLIEKNGCLYYDGQLKFSTGLIKDKPDAFELVNQDVNA